MKTNKTKKRFDIIVGIDSGETSGAAILVNGKIVNDYLKLLMPDHGLSSYGKINSEDYRYSVIANVYYLGISLVSSNPETLFIFEDWPSPYLPGKKDDPKRMGHKQLLAMGENRGRWLEQIERRCNRFKIASVATRTWRKGYGLNGYPKEQVKKMAIETANSLFKINVADDNEAEALLIAHWGYQNYGR